MSPVFRPKPTGQPRPTPKTLAMTATAALRAALNILHHYASKATVTTSEATAVEGARHSLRAALAAPAAEPHMTVSRGPLTGNPSKDVPDALRVEAEQDTTIHMTAAEPQGLDVERLHTTLAELFGTRWAGWYAGKVAARYQRLSQQPEDDRP